MVKIKNLDFQVRTVLQKDERSRNSDIRLMQILWYFYYRDKLVEIDGKWFVALETLYDLPREDNIKRIRAKIQNEERLYLPTDPAIAKKRGWLEDEWRGYIGASVAGVDGQTL